MQSAKGRLIAISADTLETQKKFKAELQAGYSFVADPEAELIRLYDVKVPVMNLANRVTFVIDKKRQIVAVSSGGDAIDPTAALNAVQQCSAR